jgi:hypothetical protein
MSTAPNDIVLLGAGFSRNWDAPLASEIADWLISQVGDDTYLRELLTQPEKNFEDALSQIQREDLSSPSSPEAKERLDKLQTAIAAMFERLNAALERRIGFDFSQDLRFSVKGFLARFDAIFGLNQDLLLELHYEDHVLLANPRRWGGLQKPGMNELRGPSMPGHKRRWTPAPPPFAVHARLQPYFKMHGSSNWYTNDGRNLIVMGGKKDLIIRQFDVLLWYYDRFKNYLSRPNTRLMVIGYSFSDQHINDAIVEAWRNRSLKGIFLVDPAGRGVLKNPTRSLPVSIHNELEDIRILGVSTRLISATFAGDEFEHQKFIDFFRS